MATNLLALGQYVQQQGELGRARGMDNRFQALTGQALAGDEAAMDQMVAMDPGRAAQVRQAGDAKALQLRGAAKYMQSALQSNDPAKVAGAWQTVRPYLAKFGKQPPEQWDDAMRPAMEQVLAKTAYLEMGGAGDEMKSVRIGANGNYWAIRGGQFVDTGVPADPRTHVRDQAGLPFDIINERTGQSIYAQPPAQAPQGQRPGQVLTAEDGTAIPTTQFTAPNGQPINFGNDIPPEFRNSVLANAPAFESLPDGASAQIGPAGGALPPRLDYSGGGERPPMRPAMTPAQVAAEQRAQEAAGRANRADARAQEAFDRSQRGNPPAGMRWNAAGTALERIPGAPPPKGSQTSEGERAAAGYLQRMAASELELQALRTAGYQPEGALRDYYTAGEGPMLNWMASAQGQHNRQQQEDWVRAKLRKESGAVIADEEMDREIKTYFPQPGDSETVIAAKARSRQLALAQMRQMAGRALRQQEAPAAPSATNGDDIDSLLDLYR